MKKRNPLIPLTIFVGCVLAGIILWWINGTLPVNPKDTSQKIFVVTKGEATRTIGYELQKAGLIRDPLVFFALVRQLGLEGKIQAGDFRLSPSQTPEQIARGLTKGSLDIWVTLPEGKRAAEVAEILKSKLPSYNPSWDALLIQHEGYLFPDTYLFPRDSSIDKIISTMTNNFNEKYTIASQGQTARLSENDAVIIASILEREGSTPDNMKQIASVLENRLSIGMALQVDATVQYALGFQPFFDTWWKKNLTTQDLQTNSPYNTYRNAGLPPTPISNPGLDALTAALHPENTNYLYYISDSKGILHFARTLDEQNTNIQKYGL